MLKKTVCLLAVFAAASLCRGGVAQEFSGINFNWRFAKGDHAACVAPEFDDSSWEQVDLPHDWAISGPFGKLTDHGGQAKLPWKGQGWYRKTFTLPEAEPGKRLQLIFDGVMSSPTVYLSGKKVGSWIYGYNSFHLDVTDAARFGGENVLVVHADTRDHFSRWYPGGGIYRKITMRMVDAVHIPVWGVCITTPHIEADRAEVNVAVEIRNTSDRELPVSAEIVLMDPGGVEVAKATHALSIRPDALQVSHQDLAVSDPLRWDIEHPRLYTARTRIYQGGRLAHEELTPFGIRTIEWTADKGVFLNGRRVQIQGVNMHHDQGPLGGAFFPRAMERQLEILMEMGVNSIRTSHNPSAPELLDLCDRMGLLVFNELFDKYGPTAGVQCSTAEYVDRYAEAEVRNFVRRDRNHPCVYTWSIANENGPLLKNEDGQAPQHVEKMVGYFKRNDATRPVTMGCNNPGAADRNRHILDALDTVGWNYQEKFLVSLENYPDKATVFSESASAFGTRGAYKLNLPEHKTDYSKDGECNAFILTAAPWADIPEVEIDRMIRYPFVAGEYVWSGFDYLGEPTPYIGGKIQPNPNGIEARSSYFGVVDLAGFPKDNYYLYRSCWRPEETTLHLTPHWNWKKGDKVPVILYTDGDEAELFLNGISLGRRKKGMQESAAGNLAFGKAARASSEEINQDQNGNVLAENVAGKAVDGNLQTRWCADSDKTPQHWQVDLGRVRSFRCLSITWEHPAQRYGFSVECSDDEGHWRKITGKRLNDGSKSLLTFPEIQARHVRITIEETKRKQWASIAEVEILKDPAAETVAAEPLANPYYDIVRQYRLCWFGIPYEPGELKAVVYKDGTRIGEVAVETAGKPVALRLTPDRPVIRADGMDLCYVVVELVDAQGRVCPWAMDELAFEVEGPARLVGVGNGNPMGHDVFTDHTHPLFYGKAVVVLRSKPGETGVVKLNVLAESGYRAGMNIQTLGASD